MINYFDDVIAGKFSLALGHEKIYKHRWTLRGDIYRAKISLTNPN